MIPITNTFEWKTFSTTETIRYWLQTVFLHALCFFFDSHSWNFEVSDWSLTEIRSIHDYRKYKANRLVCEFCLRNFFFFEQEKNLTKDELSTYERETSRLYEREVLVRHNELVQRKTKHTT
jgi:hypothetical protein